MARKPEVKMPDLGELNIDDFSIDADDVTQLSWNLMLLGYYASFKGHAMRTRLAGQMDQATKHEATCQQIYDMLPSHWRW